MRVASTYAETTVINQVGSQAENPGNYSDGPHASLLKYTDVSKRVVKAFNGQQGEIPVVTKRLLVLQKSMGNQPSVQTAVTTRF